MLKQRWVSAAIVLAGVLGVVGWWATSERAAPEVEQYVATAVGQQRELRLADGSQVVLNTRTTLVMRQSQSRAEVDLRSGEALFDTVDAVPKHLRVSAGPALVEASHARFSVIRTSQSSCVVRVFSGNVRLFPVSSLMRVNLEAGRSARFSGGDVAVDRFSPEKAVRLQSWTEGRLLFDGESLADVTSEFNRYNREHFLIADDSLAQFRIGGGYKATNPVGFARALEATFNIRAVSVRSGGRGASVILLMKRPGVKPRAQPPILRRTVSPHETV